MWRHNSTEVLCAFFLYTPYKVVSSVILFGLMSGVVLTHVRRVPSLSDDSPTKLRVILYYNVGLFFFFWGGKICKLE